MASSEDSTVKLDLKDADGEPQDGLNLGSSLCGTIYIDFSGKIKHFDHASEAIFKTSKSRVVGKSLTKTVLGKSVELTEFIDQHFKRTLDGKRCLETTAFRSDGSTFSCRVGIDDAKVEREFLVLKIRDVSIMNTRDQAVWLASIVTFSQEAIMGFDLQGKIISWNRAAERIYGYTEDEIIGKYGSTLIPLGQDPDFSRLFDRARSGKHIIGLETFMAAKDGSRIIVALTLSPIEDENERTIGVSAIARDITAAKVAQAALRKANDTTIHSSPIPIIAADTQNRVTIWNRAAAATFGWSEHEVIGNRLPIIPQEESARAHELHRRLLAGETVTGIQVRRKKRDGTLLTVNLSASPVRDAHHNIKGIVGFLTDITDLKRSEEALRRAEEKYRGIFENAVEGIYQATPDGKYLSANPALARMLGFDWPEDLIAARDNIGAQEYVNPEARLKFIRQIEQQGIVKDFMYEAKKRDGKPVWLSANARAVRARDGQVLYLEGTVQDITERRELELQVRQMQKIEAIGRLAGGVAHDFNNILMAISSYAELLAKKITDPSIRNYIDEIDKAATRGATLTKGLLTFSRKQPVNATVLNLNSVVSAQLSMLRRLIPESVELVYCPGDSVRSIKADASQIEQVIMNLVINARDAIPSGGLVTIETGMVSSGENPSGECVFLSVRDNGCGMSEETKSHIFEPFFTTKEQGKGTGLGLATVFGVVKQNAGRIEVESQLDRGTTFKIYLPSTREDPAEVSSDDSIETVAAGETILLVEDEASVRAAAAEYLSACGYRILQAGCGDDALRVAQQCDDRIDVLLTDLVMPRMSGKELAERVSVLHPETRIIFMSGYSSDVLKEAPCAQHSLLQKPLKLKEVAQCIRKNLVQRNYTSWR